MDKKPHGLVGYKRTPEHAAKLAAGNRARALLPVSMETRAKISAACKGLPKSEEHRRKIGAAHVGKKHPNRAPCTAETRAKRSAALKGRVVTPEWRRKLSLAITGRKLTFSAEHRAHLSAALKGKPKSAAHREKMAVNRLATLMRLCLKKPTRIEIAVAATLDTLGVEFIPQYPVGRYLVDLMLPAQRLAIECDGDYWHTRPGAAEKDARKDAMLQAHGYRVLRLWERVIKAGGAEAVIVAALREQENA